jgi:hypothetical protein
LEVGGQLTDTFRDNSWIDPIFRKSRSTKEDENDDHSLSFHTEAVGGHAIQVIYYPPEYKEIRRGA